MTTVERANKASAEKIRRKLVLSYADSSPTELLAPLKDGERVLVEILTGHSVPATLRKWIFDLFESNMKSLYEASASGYDAMEKKTELFDLASRFIVLRSQTTSLPFAFAIFRFDTEEGEGDDMDEVLYCYEVQVDHTRQSCGAGKLLMDLMMQACRDWQLKKVMLTVFKHNAGALKFYHNVGYTIDGISPSLCGEDEEYEILSRSA